MMRRRLSLFGILLLLAGCASVVTTDTTTVPQPPTSTTRAATTSTMEATTTTTLPTGGLLVRLDPETLQPADGVEAFTLPNNSWSLIARDGSAMVNVHCDHTQSRCFEAAGFDLVAWESWDTVEVGPHDQRAVDGSTFYGYDGRFGSTGRGLFAVDLITGVETRFGGWEDTLYLWDGLHVLPEGRLAGLGQSASDDARIYVYDTTSGESLVIDVGRLTREDLHSGVFDGDYEIPIWDTPGVAWSTDRVFLVHADDLEITEVDLSSGEVETHDLKATSWLNRLLAFWMPAALAKGPSFGTYSSAALSRDGRYLFFSGNRSYVEKRADGTLAELQEHLGLTVVDTETWEVVARPELDVQFVRNAGDLVLGTDTTSTDAWTEDHYVFEVAESGDLTVQGPFSLREGWCDEAAQSTRLLCVGRGIAQLYDLQTTTVIAEVPIAPEDMIHGIGVLEDWRPLNSP